MTDRELLELAAKAAGIDYEEYLPDDDRTIDEQFDAIIRSLWNPLTDDGDALRLAVKCHIEVQLTRRKAVAIKIEGQQPVITLCEYEERGNAIRRAIVRAAAEIGRAK